MNRFASFLVQRLQVGKAEPPYVELRERRMSDGEARNTQVIFAGVGVSQEAGIFEICKKPMHRADRQAGLLGNFARRKPIRGLRKEAEQPQATLHRSDVVVAFRGNSHGMLLVRLDSSEFA